MKFKSLPHLLLGSEAGTNCFSRMENRAPQRCTYTMYLTYAGREPRGTLRLALAVT